MTAEEAIPTFCATHPQVETGLRCATCSVPICPRCLVQTPVGAKCKACARLRSPVIYQVGLRNYLRASGAGLGVATLGGMIITQIPYYSFILMLVAGYVVGEAVSAAANRKRGTGLMVVAAAGAALGLSLGPALFVAMFSPLPLDYRASVALGIFISHLLGPNLLPVGIAAAIAAWRLR